MRGPTLIVAMDEERGIGRGGTMPWHHPEDLRHFAATTRGHVVVVGRTTLESLPGPLPGRRLVAVGRFAGPPPHGATPAAGLAEALALAGDGRAFVAGGVRMYEEALPLASEILVTRLPGRHGCDRHFPAFEGSGWDLADRRPAAGGLAFETWRRLA